MEQSAEELYTWQIFFDMQDKNKPKSGNQNTQQAPQIINRQQKKSWV